MTPSRIESIDFRGQPAFRLQAHGATAIVSRFGAQVLSWQPAGGRERLFLSERAVMDGRSAIRGGVPLCFPQFATRGSGPRHGFARSTEWTSVEQRDIDGNALLTLQLPLEAHRAHWPFDAQVEFSVLLDATRLDLELGVDNLGDDPLQFNAALHSYFAVSDIEDVVLTGLRGTRYLDTMDNDAEHTERSDALRITGEIDRIHGPVQGALMLRDDNGALGIHGDQFPDVVVWNPGPDKAAALADLAPGDWRRFVCVEAGAILEPITVAAGDSWWGRQSLVDLTLTVRAQGN